MKRFTFIFALLLATATIMAEEFTLGKLTFETLSDTEVELVGADKGITNIYLNSPITYQGKSYSVTSIGAGVFEGCSGLTSITIPNSVTSIGAGAFANCSSLTSVTIPNSVTSIGDGAFLGCKSLTSVTIPNSVTSIGGVAFFYCSGLTSITIPNSVTSIGESAFNNCSGLTSIVVEQGNTVYDSRDNCNAIIETATNTLIRGCQNTIIPNSVTSIREYSAFSGCSGLTSITIPNSVTSIGDKAFSGCTGLISIVVEQGNTVYDSRDNCNAIIETATNTLISGCQNTTIPNSVTSIGDWAFDDCSSLTSITIPNSVTSIGNYAFLGCKSLTSITIPESVTEIGYEAFSGCAALTKVNYNGTKASWSLVEKNPDWMVGSSIKSIYCWDVMITMEEEIVDLFGEEVFIVVESMPEFPGGQQAMMKFLGENIQYPANAVEKGIQGRVICKFVVEKDGNVSDIQVVRTSGDASLDSEAVRVISTMPKWKPGVQRGKPVRVIYTIPINFRLSDEPKEGAKP